MARSHFESPFPPLQLSHDDAARIEQLTHMLVRTHVAQYERYLGPGKARVDERKWKFMRQRENVRVYAERRRRKPNRDPPVTDGNDDRQSPTAAVSPTPSDASSSFTSTPAAPDLPVIHVVGSVDGTLDDILYGIVNPTLDVMRVKAAYIRVNLSHIAVLATLATPTPARPFQSVTIKWVENVQKAVLRPAVNSRDFVYIEATGTTTTSSGERVGYHLLHSVHFLQTRALPSFVRGNMSVCGLYRQLPGRTDLVDVYFKGTLDPGGLALRPLVVIAAVDVFIAIWKYVECSRLKKLAWLLRTRHCGDASLSAGSSHASSDSTGAASLGSLTAPLDSVGKFERQQQMEPTQCVVCCKPPAVAMLTSLRRRRCSLCGRYICSRCRIKKTLCHLTAVDAKLLQRAFAFCPPCYDDAIHADAFAIAQQELAALDAFTFGSELFRRSDSSDASRFSTNSLADSLFS